MHDCSNRVGDCSIIEYLDQTLAKPIPIKKGFWKSLELSRYLLWLLPDLVPARDCHCMVQMMHRISVAVIKFWLSPILFSYDENELHFML